MNCACNENMFDLEFAHLTMVSKRLHMRKCFPVFSYSEIVLVTISHSEPNKISQLYVVKILVLFLLKTYCIRDRFYLPAIYSFAAHLYNEHRTYHFALTTR